MNFRWEWEVFLRDTGGGQTYLEWLMSAWGWTLSVAACAWVVAFVLGSVVGTLRTTPNPWLVRLGNAWVELSASIGIALYPNHGEDAQSLLQRADTAMYQAKRSGKNVWRFFSLDPG